MAKLTLSYALAFCAALLIIAPPLNYEVPVMVNSFVWVYLSVASGLFGMFILFQKAHWSLKALSVYLFSSCFLSQAPYLSFNAYMLVTAAFYFYLAFRHCDFKVIINAISAAFVLELILTVFQIFGKDTLLNFNRPEPVFLGTVMQYMRFASVLAIMAPFLILKSRWYLIPIIALCVFSQSSSFAVSLIAGVFVYGLLSLKGWKARAFMIAAALTVLGAYAAYDWGSFRGAIIPSNGGRLISWVYIVKTWVMDTSLALDVTAIGISGPFQWKWFLFGHGMDTFLPLFPVYKHDMNPFPQAHNCWLQFPWEIGIVGLSLIASYSVSLIGRLYRTGRNELIGGLACIGTNMFFAFPTRMTQTALLIVAYLAFCEIAVGNASEAKLNHPEEV